MKKKISLIRVLKMPFFLNKPVYEPLYSVCPSGCLSVHPLNVVCMSPPPCAFYIQDNLKTSRSQQNIKTTSKHQDDLKASSQLKTSRRLQSIKAALKHQDYLKTSGRPQNIKMTSKHQNNLKKSDEERIRRHFFLIIKGVDHFIFCLQKLS